VNPRRLRLMDECWPILATAFDTALKALEPAEAGAGRATHATSPGRLVTTLSTIRGGSDKNLGGQDTDLTTKGSVCRCDIDELVELCREQKNGSPVATKLLDRLVADENPKVLDGLYKRAISVAPTEATLEESLKKVADRVTARPLVVLVRARDEQPSGELAGQVRTGVDLRGQDRALAYSNARHLVVRQIIAPETPDWDLADGNGVELFISTRSILRRQADHGVFLWT
jgi:hypothetical protein